jgi:hypothetical protein
MIRSVAGAAMLAIAATMPLEPAAAQDPGAVLGGALLGGVIGGAATGRAGGAIAGAVIGGATAAIIDAEAQRYRGGYYWWRGRCYYRYPNGDFARARRSHCD